MLQFSEMLYWNWKLEKISRFSFKSDFQFLLKTSIFRKMSSIVARFSWFEEAKHTKLNYKITQKIFLGWSLFCILFHSTLFSWPVILRTCKISTFSAVDICAKCSQNCTLPCFRFSSASNMANPFSNYRHFPSCWRWRRIYCYC